jgi:hypothetical protein
MAQTTGQMSGANAKIEFSVDGSSYSDISGSANQLRTTGGDRQSGETYTVAGDNALVTTGKRTPVNIAVAGVYTEVSGELFELLRTTWEAGSAAYVRWSPKGSHTGDHVFTSGPGRLTNFVYPDIDESNGNPIVAGFTYRGPAPVESTAT